MTAREKGITQRSLKAQATKDQLFGTDLGLFVRHGYEKVTVDDITKFAGVSKGTFYTHFPTKDAVFVEHFRRIDAYYLQVFRTVRETMSAPERLRLLFRAVCAYCADICGVEVLKLVYANQVGAAKVSGVFTRERALYPLLEGIVRQGRADGAFIPGPSLDETVDYLVRSMRSLPYEWCLRNGAFDLKQKGEEHATLLIAGLLAR